VVVVVTEVVEFELLIVLALLLALKVEEFVAFEFNVP
jgi:hypothetical protein